MRRIPVALAIVGATYMFLWATRNGPVMHSDSYEYLTAATIAAEGNPLLQGDNSLLYFPPLYPFALGGLMRALHVSVENAARLVSASVFGLNIYVAGRMLQVVTGSAGAGAVASLIMLASPRFRLDHAEALSDPLFTLLFQLSALGVVRYFASLSLRWVAFATLVAGMSAFTRYIGYATVMAAGLALLYAAYRRTDSSERWRTVALIVALSAVAVIPNAAWHWRNLVLHGVLAGGDLPKTALTLGQSVSMLIVDTGRYWSWSTRPSPVHTALAIIVVVVAIAGFRRSRGLLHIYWVFGTVYAASLLVSASALDATWRSEYGEPLFSMLNALFVAGCQSLRDRVKPATTGMRAGA